MLRINYDGRDIHVRFYHRVVDTELDGKRRCTWARVILLHELETFVGEATCHPKDNFCKSTGRKLALANAMIGFKRDLRVAVWEEYHRQCK